MPEAKQGDKVKVHYVGTLDDGTKFDSSREREPLEFEIGSGVVIAGFEEAVAGMTPGDTKSVRIEADNAYGTHKQELVLEVGRQQIPSDLDVSIGQPLRVQTPDGGSARVVVAGVSEDTVTLDANHPLAGQDLSFEIELLEITAVT